MTNPSREGKLLLLLIRIRIYCQNIHNIYCWLICRIGFVLQDDIVFPHLTVKETLTYAALLRLPTSLTKNQKKERAMDVIGELGLERYML